jgi:hypothetical protein
VTAFWALLRCLWAGHEPLLVQVRDARGRVCVPHRVRWECRCCGAVLGETALRAH